MLSLRGRSVNLMVAAFSRHMPSAQQIEPGQVLGRYEFLVPIAEGGMASVWAARLKGSRGFSKTVAIKTMLPGVSEDPAFEQMFLDEAQIASRIRHPNVAEILDLGEENEVLYLVMEWVDGEPLANLRRAAAKHGGIPRPIAVRLVADAAAGLHGAHELKDESGQLVGLVHRDMSPQNLLVTFDGVVKVVDFGVAKAAGRSSEKTNAGQVKGKPPYMSPEQALGEIVDRRTDVFALGIILYQLTTGKHPFRGESDLVTLQNIVSDKPIVSPRAYDKQYPRKLENVVMKALDRRRESRFQTCAELDAALHDVFDKDVPRARTEDVGKFVTEMLGARGEERRRALTEAIRLADERAGGAVISLGPSRVAGSMPASLPTPPSGQIFALGAPLPRTDTDPNSVRAMPEGTTLAPEPPRRGRVGIVVAALVAAAAIGAVAAIKNAPSQTDEAVTAGAASRPPEARLQKPEPPPPAPVQATEPGPSAVEESPALPDDAKSKAAGKRSKGKVRTAGTETAVGIASPTPKPVAATPSPVSPVSAPPAPKPKSAAGSTAPKSGFVPPPVSDPGF